MDKFMERAVELAAGNVRDGGQPFGAVLVKNGHVVEEGVNETHKRFDVSAHAELLAIRRAQKKMHTHVLPGYTMYASGEPCPMCVTAMQFAGIDSVYYCASVDDAAEAGLEKSKMIYEELKKSRNDRTIKMMRMPLKEGQENPMELWKNRS
ncbi:nucleoside deaminase [Virgibacillus oceani]|uniref:tRNA-specific adenosine deaminase n=1 Tax=Virgibacillus oceani TaxID=1479511 RepID=A0A917M6U2_9BACI|nr:nucleoside deaminase [Virgibacillus oceani]GGG81098.1 tRNA-specific adenosine deaminase [Virgibacillus oceani]